MPTSFPYTSIMPTITHDFTPGKIKELRKALGLSTTEIAGRMGLSGRTWEDWEQGRRRPNGSAVVLLSQLQDELVAENARGEKA